MPKALVNDMRTVVNFAIGKEVADMKVNYSENLIAFSFVIEDIKIIATSLLIQGNFPEYEREEVLPTENETITYITSLEENTASLNIRKIIQKSGQEDEKHHLNFNLKSPKKNLIVTIDDFKLYEEEVDLTDASKALNVTNKFSKFEFLYREELSKLENELEEKEKKKQTKVFSTIFHQF